MSKKTKQILSLFMSMVMIMSMFARINVSSFATDDILSSLTWEIIDGEVTITDCDESISGEVVIPDTIEGYLVTAIGESAFYYCQRLASVKIPDSITTIGDQAFSKCYALSEIDMGNNVNSIGASVFLGCNKLTSITIPEGVTTISDSLFYGCEELSSIDLPDSVTSIGYGAFSHCDALSSIDIPDSVTSIDIAGFSNCKSLVNISVDAENQYFSSDFDGVLFDKEKTTLICYPGGKSNAEYIVPKGVINIDNYAFSEHDSLSSVDLPNSVISIGDGAFSYCNALSSVDLPNSVISIGDGAFSYCDALSSIDLPDSVISIGDTAFLYCTALANISIPETKISIGANAFSNTAYYNNESNWQDGALYVGKHLISASKVSGEYRIKDETITIANNAFSYPEIHNEKNVIIPASVEHIGYHAFSYCFSLTGITVENENKYYSSDSIGALFDKNKTVFIQYPIDNESAEYVIPDSVIVINDYAFAANVYLESISISKGVTDIGESAFVVRYLSDIYYSGSETDWNNIAVKEGNSYYLENSTIHFGIMNDGTTTDNPTTDDPTTDDPATDGPATDGPATDDPATDGPATDGPATDDPATDGPATDGPATDGPATDDPATDGPATDDPTTDGPAMQENGKLDVKNEGGIVTDFENKISQIGAGESVNTVSSMIENEKFAIVDNDGNALDADALVGTGCKIQIFDNDGNVISEYTVVVPSDVDGNGKTTAADARLALRAGAKIDILDGVYLTASDANSDGTVTAADARIILRKSAGLDA